MGFGIGKCAKLIMKSCKIETIQNSNRTFGESKTTIS